MQTQFLDSRELNIVLPILNKLKIKYNIYKPHEYCEKSIIIFGDNVNLGIGCIKVECKHFLEHKDYLGTIFSLGIDRHSFGDILIDGNTSYIYFDKKLVDFVIYNMTQIKNYNVELEEININDVIINKNRFINLSIHSSSNRIDSIISKLTNKSREDVKKLINKNKVLLNYNILKNNSIFLKDNDVFSISGYGKYIYRDISKQTKKGNLIISIDKYN